MCTPFIYNFIKCYQCILSGGTHCIPSCVYPHCIKLCYVHSYVHKVMDKVLAKQCVPPGFETVCRHGSRHGWLGLKLIY